MEIVIKRYPVQTVELFTPNDISLGFVNEHELTDVRVQIARNKLGGYYLLFNDTKIFIDTKGKINNWVDGLFDTQELLLGELFRINYTK